MAAPNQSPKTAAQLSFLGGMDSRSNPALVGESGYRYAVNLLNRGGSLTTRPGHKWKISFPKPEGENSVAQGLCHFKQLGGADNLVAVVDGTVWVSSGDMLTWRELYRGFRRDMNSVYFAVCEQAAELNDDGSVSVREPRRVLVIQDGISTPVAWDGFRLLSATGIPVGTVMCWSGDRLWVASGPQLFASDISNPLGFSETGYIGLGGSLLFPLPITALTNGTDTGGRMLVFTSGSMHAVATSIRQRDTWSSTKDFITEISSYLGCVSHRAVAQQHGLLWWMSRDGLMNFDEAARAAVSSYVPIVDGGMDLSRSRTADNYGSCCLGAIGGLLFISVPFASQTNTHTWVLDGAVSSGFRQTSSGGTLSDPGMRAWASVWEGTSPVEWVSGFIAGRSALYHLSISPAGVASVYESLTDSDSDDGVPVQWSFESRGFTTDGFTPLELKSLDLRFSNIRGDLDVAAFVAPSFYGPPQKVLTHHAKGALSQFRKHAGDLIYGDTDIFSAYAIGGYRQIRSEQPRSSLSLTCSVESGRLPGRSEAFTILVKGVGACSLTGMRLVFLPESENLDGKCATESGSTATMEDGGSVTGENQSDEPSMTLFTDTFGGFTSSTVVSQDAARRINLGKKEAFDRAYQYWSDPILAPTLIRLPA